MRFVADLALGRLAKWLRLCGFDAAVRALPPVPSSLPPPAPGTVLLTRQAGWGPSPREDVLVLTANDPGEQLAEVLRRLKLTRRDLAPLSRCGECNEPLAPVSRETAQGLVPDHVFHTQGEFFQCPRCQRLYWPGSHPPRITAKLKEILKGKARPRPVRSHPRKGASHGV